MNCFVERVDEFACKQPDAAAVTAGKKSLSYAALSALSRQFASFLLSKGVGRGDYVVCRASQSLEYVVAHAAVLRLSAVFIPLERDCPAEVILEKGKYFSAKAAIGREGDEAAGTIFVDAEKVLEIAKESGLVSLPPLEKNVETQILFTTGSTGKSKGVVLSDARLNEGERVGEFLGYDTHTVCYTFAPTNHVAFFILSSAVFAYGGELIVSQGLTDLGDFLYALEKRKANAVHATPSVFHFWLAHCGEFLSEFAAQLKVISLAGEKCLLQTQTELKALFSDTRLYVLYGCTETGMVSGFDFSSQEAEDGCVGVPLKDVQVKIEEGRIVVKTPRAMKKYLGGTDCGGVVFTDDRGEIHNGKLYVLGRISDVIISGGNKIDPTEVEEAVKEFGGVSDCVCSSVKDAVLGQALKLFVQWKGGEEAEVLKRYLFTRLEGYKVPRLIESVNEVKKNINGKTDRKFYKEG